MFKKAFATTEALDKGQAQRVKLVTIWFGTESSRPVSLLTVKEQMIVFLKAALNTFHWIDTKIISSN